jgi:D-arginine dehydrogenase
VSVRFRPIPTFSNRGWSRAQAWAGLRAFAPNKNFVVGFDPRRSGFYCLAGQGGYGVQAAPGLAQLALAQIGQSTLSDQYAPVLHYIDAVSPERLL